MDHLYKLLLTLKRKLYNLYVLPGVHIRLDHFSTIISGAELVRQSFQKLLKYHPKT